MKGFLIVDDDKDVRIPMCILLAAAYPDALILHAENGRQACDKMADHHGEIDLVITDTQMPGMSGIELVEIIRREYPEVHVILSSAALAEPTGHNAHAFLSKPAREAEVLALVEKVMAGP